MLTSEDKLIKPADLKGIAGGIKYIRRGILFKFAVDKHGIYGGDEYAAKGVLFSFHCSLHLAAGHELKGLMGYTHARVKALHFPLMALIGTLARLFCAVR